MYLRIKYTRKDGYVHIADGDGFTTIEKVKKTFNLLKHLFKSIEEHNVPANHPRYIHDKQEMALWGVSAVGLVGEIGRKT